MKVMVVGCGRLGSQLVARLAKQEHEIVVVDSSPTAFANLPANFACRTVEGEAMDQDVLRRAGIANMDAVVVATNSDSLNMVIGHIAQTFYNVPRVVVRNYSPTCRALFEDFNLQVVSSAAWGAQRMEEMIYHSDLRTVFSAGNGEVEIYEITVPENCAGRKLSELVNCPECVVVSVTRVGRAAIPPKDMVLLEADVIHVSATFDGVRSLRQRLCDLPLEGKK
jgi:trk system potassium uptake protein TrkA